MWNFPDFSQTFFRCVVGVQVCHSAAEAWPVRSVGAPDGAVCCGAGLVVAGQTERAGGSTFRTLPTTRKRIDEAEIADRILVSPISPVFFSLNAMYYVLSFYFRFCESFRAINFLIALIALTDFDLCSNTAVRSPSLPLLKISTSIIHVNAWTRLILIYRVRRDGRLSWPVVASS